MSDAPWEKYAQPSADGPWAKYAPKAVTSTPISSAPAVPSTPHTLPTWGDVGSEFKKEYQEGDAAYRAGDQQIGQGGVWNTIKGAGKVALGLGEIASEPITAPVKALVGDPLRKVIPGKAGEYAGQAVEDTALMFAPGTYGRVGREAAVAGSELANSAKGFVSKFTDKAAVPTAADVKALSSSFYADAAAKGGTLTPKFTNDFIEEAAKHAPQTEEGKIVLGENSVTQLVSRLQNLKDKPLSLDAAQEIDEGLGAMISKEYGLTGLSKEGHKISEMQSNFREQIENAGAEHTTGGTAGFDALKSARKAWAQAAKMRDIEQVITRSQHSEQPVTALRSGFRTILSNPKKLRGFSKEEIAALKEAAKTGVVTDIYRQLGSRLVPLAAEATGAAVGGLPGWAAGAAVGNVGASLARDAATARQMKKVNNLMGVLGRGTTATDAAESLGVAP